MVDATTDGSALHPEPLPVAECTDDDRTSRLAGTADGRTRAARLTGWMENMHSPDAYDAIAMAKSTKEAVRSSSSFKVHAGMRAGYLEFCKHLMVNPRKVNPTTAAQVANFDKRRLKNNTLGLSTSKHISAQMGLFFSELGHSGPWTTGIINGVPYADGNPNESKAVTDSKRTHKIFLADQGRAPVPMDSLAYGHFCAYYDHFLAYRDDVSRT